MPVIQMVKLASPIKCTMCEYTFKNNRELIEHMDSEHGGQLEEEKKNETLSEESGEKFVCDLCEKVFDKKGPMSNHRILVHTIRTKEMHCDFCDDIFSTKKDLCSHISYKHSEHFIKKEPANMEVEAEKVELDYILDEVKNLEVAKTNARTALNPKRNDIDELNIKIELNSAVYLISKDELLTITIGQPEEKAIVKLKVTDLESKFESKVTMNLYHSSQGVHLQSGRRQGKNTSCSLAATYLEQFFKEIL